MRIYKKHSDFKVLFLYPNLVMSALAPQGIGYLSAILKREGFTVDLFDTTFYTSDLAGNANDEKAYMSKVRPLIGENEISNPKPLTWWKIYKNRLMSFNRIC